MPKTHSFRDVRACAQEFAFDVSLFPSLGDNAAALFNLAAPLLVCTSDFSKWALFAGPLSVSDVARPLASLALRVLN